MGLLDSILRGVAGNVLGGRGNMGGLGGLGRGQSGRGNLLVALLPVVLGMLANRRGGVSGMQGSGLGGLSGLTGEGGTAGLGGLLQRFQQNGYGDQVQSWVSTGDNQAIPPEALSSVFGDDELTQIASQAGVSTDEARMGLSELLPQVVDQLTPQGQLPESDQLLSSIDEFERELQQRS